MAGLIYRFFKKLSKNACKASLIEQQPKLVFAGPVDTLVQQHPYLGILSYKLDVLAIEKRYNQEQLKPQIELKYNFLNEPIQYNPLAQFSINDYKWGVSAQMPLFLRKERAAVQQTKLKIAITWKRGIIWEKQRGIVTTG